MAWSWAFLNMWQFYLIVALFALFGYKALQPLVKKFPVLNNQPLLILISLLGLAATSGVFGTMSFGSVGGSPRSSGSGVQIADLQVTTAFSGNCTNAANNNIDDLIDVRCNATDTTFISENSAHYETDTGIITVFRTGDLPAMSCPVVASTQEGFSSERSPGDGNKYTIVEETTLGELEVYLNAKKSGSGAAAATTSPKERTTLEFDEGASQAHLGVLIEADVDAAKQLTQYSSKDVVVDICGKPFTFRITQMG